MADQNKKARKKVTPEKSDSKSALRSGHTKPNMSDLIGARLKLYYDEVAEQPVPDRFLKLLDELETSSNRKKAD